MDLLDDLQWRGLIYQTTDIDSLRKLLQHNKITFYEGFDPSCDSLQLGNLLTLITAKRFQIAGHKPIILVGGATGMIGDPSDKKSERKLLNEQTVKNNTKKIASQIKHIFNSFDSKHISNKVKIVNNYDWFKNITFLTFMRDIGKYFSINYLLSREWVKTRLDSGISFAEFGYSLIQAYDYFILNLKYNCQLEIGGSDQWGNIIAGVDLIKNKTHKEVYGLSIPLLLHSDGTKFGKSVQNCIYLDPNKTTPYQMYQYLVNIDDRDIIHFLKQFTFLSIKEIKQYETKIIQNPELREAQKFLAKFIVKLIHGTKAVSKCEKISNALFYGDFQKLTQKELEQGLNDVPTFEIIDHKQINVIDLLVSGNISSSKRQAKEDIINKAITINGKNISDIELQLTKKDCLFNTYLIIRRGKKTYFLGKWI